ncbi:MAG: hypothetical protein ABL895_11820 [Cyclobacteriaceae bacterium]
MYLLAAIGFPLLTLAFYFLLFRNLKSAISKTSWTEAKKNKIRAGILWGLILWMAIVSAISLSGFSGNFKNFPFNVMPLVGVPLITTIILLFTSEMKTLLGYLSLKTLTQLQVFRVFVEFLLWLLFIQNLLPEQMTFEGRNWDILSGLTALLAARFLLLSKHWMIVWNILGLGLLINIVTIAILSMPTPFRIFENEPANTIVTQFPFVFLPAFLVPLAYILHLMSLRKLLIKS